MKIIYVYGSDYSATAFNNYIERVGMTLSEAWDKAKEEGTWAHETEEVYFEAQAMEYGEVDPAFIDFLRQEMIDYDSSKSTDFFVVEE